MSAGGCQTALAVLVTHYSLKLLACAFKMSYLKSSAHSLEATSVVSVDNSYARF